MQSDKKMQSSKKGVALILALVLIVGLFYFWKSTNFGYDKTTGDTNPTLGETFSQVGEDEENFIQVLGATDFWNGFQGDSDAILIDVRRPEEIDQSKIEGAIELNFESANFASQINKLDRGKTYYIYCRTGNRSAQAAQLMNDMGFESIIDLAGGIQSWTASGLPTCRDC